MKEPWLGVGCWVMGVGCWVMMACWGVGVLGDDGLLGCWVMGDG
nr:hypothetical protein [uncultured Prevotella sp.]